jgi:hypothetical protein
MFCETLYLLREPKDLALIISESAIKMAVQGTLSRDFRPLVFFHQSTPPRAVTHGLKPFRIWLCICLSSMGIPMK